MKGKSCLSLSLAKKNSKKCRRVCLWETSRNVFGVHQKVLLPSSSWQRKGQTTTETFVGSLFWFGVHLGKPTVNSKWHFANSSVSICSLSAASLKERSNLHLLFSAPARQAVLRKDLVCAGDHEVNQHLAVSLQRRWSVLQCESRCGYRRDD